MMLAMVGCGEKDTTPQTPPPPPPPTASEIAGEFRKELQSFNNFIVKDLIVPPVQAQEALGKLRTLNQKHMTSVNGEEGRKMAGDNIEQMLTRSNESEAWSMVLFSFDALAVVAPTATDNYARLRSQATLQVNRPRIEIKGIFKYDEDKDTVITEVTVPASGQIFKHNFQEGDSFTATVDSQQYEVQLIQIIGNADGAIFKYLQTGEEFEVRS
jgi:hypothetical protein